MLAHESYVSAGAPGYPLLIAPVLFLLHDRVLSGAVISFLCGVLLPWPVWALARGRVGAAFAALPALAIALHPALARYSAIVMSESAFLLALYGALALTEVSALAAGALLGAAYVIRPEAILVAGVLALRGAWRLAKRRATVRHALLGVAGFLALMIPCVLWYHATAGQWTVSPKLAGVGAAPSDWRTIEPRITPTTAPPPAPTMTERILEARNNLRPGVVRYTGWMVDLWSVPLLLLSLIGLTQGAGVEAAPLTQLIALLAFGSMVPRFLLPMLPAMAVLAALTARRMRGKLAIAATVLAAAGVAMFWKSGAREFVTPYDGNMQPHVAAGLWLGQNSAPGETVVDRKPFIAFYAGRHYVVMPDAPYDSLVSWAVRNRARWLVVDQGEAAVFRQQLEPLLYDAEFRDRETRLELAYVGGRHKGYGVGLFRVLHPGEARSGRPPASEASWLTRP